MVGVLIPLFIVRDKDAKVSTLIASIIGGFVAFSMAWWIRPPLMYPGGQLMITMLFTVGTTLFAYSCCRAFSVSGASEDDTRVLGTGLVAVFLCAVIGLFITLSSWDVLRAEGYAAVIGDVKVHQEQLATQNYLDFSHPRLVTKDQATLKISSQSSQLGTQASLVSFNDVWPTGDTWVGALEPVSADPWGFGKILEQGGLKGIISVSADEPLDNAKVTVLKDGIKYTPTSFGRYNTKRAVYNSVPSLAQDFTTLHVSQTTGNPENVIVLSRPVIGYSMPVVEKIAVQDAVTGALSFYTPENLPEEYNLLYSSQMAVDRFNSWGSYRFGWYQHAFGRVNLEHVAQDGLSNEVWLVKGADDRLKYYMAVKWRNSAGSIDGFALFDTRTGETEIFELPAADPQKVRTVMQNNAPATSGSPWIATEPKQLMTPEGMDVWVATYEANGAFQAVGVADLQGNIAAYGRNFSEAMEKFRSRIFESSELIGVLASKATREVTLTGSYYTMVEDGRSFMIFEVQGGQPIEVKADSLDMAFPFQSKDAKVTVEYLTFGGRDVTHHGALQVSSLTAS